jgi:hypothetical protein
VVLVTLVALVVVDADFFGAGAFLVVVAFLTGVAFFTAGFLAADLASLGFLAAGLASLTLPLIPVVMRPGHMSTLILRPGRNLKQNDCRNLPLGRLKTPFSALKILTEH